MAADRDLLFGLLALRNGLINQGQLVAAFQAWTLDKARPWPTTSSVAATSMPTTDQSSMPSWRATSRSTAVTWSGAPPQSRRAVRPAPVAPRLPGAHDRPRFPARPVLERHGCRPLMACRPPTRADDNPAAFVFGRGRGPDRGLTPEDLADWYARRTGGEVPPAVRLLLAPAGSRVPPLRAARMLVLTLPDAGLLDGLLQHPATSPWLGERLGPTAVEIPEDRIESLRKVLDELGIELER
jgi:hypothetical protein